GRRNRNNQANARSALGRRFHGYSTAMLLHDMQRYRKSQAEAAFMSGEKRVEDPAEDLGRDAMPVVSHAKHGVLLLDPGGDFDLASAGTGLDGVHREIQQRLLHLFGIAAERREFRRYVRAE